MTTLAALSPFLLLSRGANALTDPMSIANKFNEYFTHIGPILADKIPYVSGSHLDCGNKSMFIKATNVHEIKRIIM